LFDVSDAPFNINMPYIDASSVKLVSGQFSFNIVAPGATQASILSSTDLANWQLLQVVSVTNGLASFTDTSASNQPARAYRLRVP
jgi:hypothetical protein